MAFKRLKGLDNTDMKQWATSECATMFRAEVTAQRDIFLRGLLRDGKDKHDYNSAGYESTNKVLKLFEEAENLK